jgi:hypothetical protein
MVSSIARTIVVGSFVAASAAAPMLAQSGGAAKESSKVDDSAVTLVGCVSGKPLASGDYTFLDGVTGTKYRLSGKGAKKFAGQQVEIVSAKDKKFVVKGGLYPSPNVAAQAGALDPGQEAIARQPGGPSSGTGSELPEFRFSRVRAVPGACQ